MVITNTQRKLDVKIAKAWAFLEDDTVPTESVTITLKRYVLNGSTKVKDESFRAEFVFTPANHTTPASMTNLPAYGTVQTTENGNTVTKVVPYYYYVEESELPEAIRDAFNVTYTNSASGSIRENGMDSAFSIEKLTANAEGKHEGTLTVNNTERTTLKILKEWGENITAADKQEVMYTLWQREVDANGNPINGSTGDSSDTGNDSESDSGSETAEQVTLTFMMRITNNWVSPEGATGDEIQASGTDIQNLMQTFTYTFN